MPVAEPPLPRAPSWDGVRLAWVMVLALMGLYTASPVATRFDSQLTIPVAVSLLRQGDIELSEYAPRLKTMDNGPDWHGGRVYNFHPLGPSLVALPCVALVDALARVGVRVRGPWTPAAERWRAHFEAEGLVDFNVWERLELRVAGLVAALSGGLFFLLARRWTTRGRALGVTVLYGAGSSVYSTASRALWQHGPSVACLTAALYLLVRAEEDERFARGLGVPLGLAYLMRPTNSLSIAVLCGYVALRWRRAVPWVALGLAGVLVPWALFNRHVYGSFLPPYFLAGRLTGEHLPEALAGNLVSPARGLFFYTPWTLVALVDFGRRVARREARPLEGAVAVILALHWVVISAFPHWWAGHSYGPRFFTDMMPYLALLTLRFGVGAERRLPLAWTALVVTGALSVAIHVRGATSWSPYEWNSTPVNVDLAPARVWDFRDLQVLRCRHLARLRSRGPWRG